MREGDIDPSVLYYTTLHHTIPYQPYILYYFHIIPYHSTPFHSLPYQVGNKSGISVAAQRKQWLGESAIRNAKLIAELTKKGFTFLRYSEV